MNYLLRKYIDIVREAEQLTELDIDSQRTITFSKENPPSGDFLLRQLIKNLNSPDNKLSPEKMISLWNQRYGLNHTLRTLAAHARNNDYVRMQFQQALARSSSL